MRKEATVAETNRNVSISKAISTHMVRVKNDISEKLIEKEYGRMVRREHSHEVENKFPPQFFLGNTKRRQGADTQVVMRSRR